MATIVHPTVDTRLDKMKRALDEYEAEHAGSTASLYRHDLYSIRVRIIDPSFAALNRWERHQLIWKYIAEKVGEDPMHDLSILLLFAPHEVEDSIMNKEFDDPTPTDL